MKISELNGNRKETETRFNIREFCLFFCKFEIVCKLSWNPHLYLLKCVYVCMCLPKGGPNCRWKLVVQGEEISAKGRKTNNKLSGSESLFYSFRKGFGFYKWREPHFALDSGLHSVTVLDVVRSNSRSKRGCFHLGRVVKRTQDCESSFNKVQQPTSNEVHMSSGSCSLHAGSYRIIDCTFFRFTGSVQVSRWSIIQVPAWEDSILLRGDVDKRHFICNIGGLIHKMSRWMKRWLW